jgi:Asp-tRNA(Asn)/Glu-tRNA(Gln) amidotransferase A subunit family amidase
VWHTDHSLAHAHPDGVGDDIRQMLSMADLFCPGLDDARGQLAAWRQSLLDLFGQVDLLALPAMPVFLPALADLAPDSLVDVIMEITQYTGLFNAAGTACTAQPIRAAGTPIPASLQIVGPPMGEELLLATARQVEAAQSATPAWPGVHALRRHAISLPERQQMRHARQRSRSARGSGWPRPARRARTRLRR